VPEVPESGTVQKNGVERELFTRLEVQENAASQTLSGGDPGVRDKNVRLLRVFLPVSEE